MIVCGVLCWSSLGLLSRHVKFVKFKFFTNLRQPSLLDVCLYYEFDITAVLNGIHIQLIPSSLCW